jgi:hypothetical protein
MKGDEDTHHPTLYVLSFSVATAQRVTPPKAAVLHFMPMISGMYLKLDHGWPAEPSPEIFHYNSCGVSITTTKYDDDRVDTEEGTHFSGKPIHSTPIDDSGASRTSKNGSGP